MYAMEKPANVRLISKTKLTLGWVTIRMYFYIPGNLQSFLTLCTISLPKTVLLKIQKDWPGMILFIWKKDYQISEKVEDTENWKGRQMEGKKNIINV